MVNHCRRLCKLARRRTSWHFFVGVNNGGSIQKPEEKIDWEEFQKTVANSINRAWPPIYPDVRIREKGGMKFVSATIYGSVNRPHFAGRSFIRVGPETREASET
jgi:predicted HTH transcriptional regulator